MTEIIVGIEVDEVEVLLIIHILLELDDVEREIEAQIIIDVMLLLTEVDEVELDEVLQLDVFDDVDVDE